jgi:cytochrome b6-f complex iron-sulfur subunit
MRALQWRRTGLVLLIALTPILSSCDSSQPADNGDPAPSDGVTLSGTQIRIDLTSERGSALAEEGGYVYVAEGQTIVIHVGDAFRAYSSACTGDGCAVDRFVETRLLCGCDASAFSENGLPVAGPARTPLARYTTTRSGNVVTVMRASSNPDPDPDPSPDPPPYGY